MAGGPWDAYAPPAAQGGAEDGPWTAYSDPQAASTPEIRPEHADSIWGAVDAAYQASTLGMVVRGRNPDVLPPKNPSIAQEAAGTVAGVAAGVPSVAVGAAVGAGAGALAGEGVGAVPGAIVGSFAVPMGVRAALVKAYDQGNGPKSWGQILAIAKSGLIGTAKGAAIGTAEALTAGAATPEIVGGALGLRGAQSVVASKLAQSGLWSAGSAMANGHVLPTWGDMAAGSLAIIGGNVKTPEETTVADAAERQRVAGRIADLYVKTGLPPEKITADVLRDPALRDQIINGNDIPDAYQHLVTQEAAKSAIPELTPEVQQAAKQRYDAMKAAGLPVPPEAPPVPIDLTNANDPETAAAIHQRLKTLFVQKITAQTRGVVSDAQAMEEATKQLVDTGGPQILGTGERDVPMGRQLPLAPGTKLPGIGFAPSYIDAQGIVHVADIASGQILHVDIPGWEGSTDGGGFVGSNGRAYTRAEAAAALPSSHLALKSPGVRDTGELNALAYRNAGGNGDIAASAARIDEENGPTLSRFTGPAGPVEPSPLGTVKPFGARAGGDPTVLADTLSRGALSFQALHDMQEEATAFSAKVKDGKASPEDYANFLAATDRGAMFTSEDLGTAAELGRALRIRRALVSVQDRQKAFQAIVDDFGGHKNVEKFAEDVSKLDSLAQVGDAARKARTLSTAGRINAIAQETWKSFLLGPHSQIVKLVGDQTRLIMSQAERTVGWGVGQALRPFGGDRLYAREVFAFSHGVLTSGRQGIAALAQALKNPYNVPDVAEEAGGMASNMHMPGNQTGVEAITRRNPFGPSAVGRTARFITSLPFRGLKGITEFYRVLNEHGQIAQDAVHKAIKEGLEPGGDEYNNRVASLLENPTQEMQDRATAQGGRGTFTAPLGDIGQLMQQASRNRILGWIIPFAKVPANVEKQFAEYLPGFGMLLKSFSGTLKNGGPEMHMAIARQMMGTAASYGAYELFKRGLITGGHLFDSAGQRNVDKVVTPYYSMKIGDKWYAYDRIPIIGGLLSVAADASDYMENSSDEQAKFAFPVALGLLFAHTTASTPFFTGFHDLFNAADEPSTLPRVVDSQLGSVVPSIFSQTAAQFDPYARNVKGDTLTQGLINEFKSRIPGLRETLPPQVSPITGQPLPNSSGWSPFSSEPVDNDVVASEAKRLGLGITGAPAQVHMLRHSGKLGEVKTTQEQQGTFDTVEGQELQKIMQRVISSPSYADIPEPQKLDLFERAIRLGRKMAIRASMTPDERRAEMQQIESAYGAAMQQK